MKILLDTVNLKEIKRSVEWSIIDGVKTNPPFITKEKANSKERIKEICQIVRGPVSVEVVSTDGVKGSYQKME